MAAATEHADLREPQQELRRRGRGARRRVHHRAGEAYGLLGPNGAGKTTTISMLVGLLKPDTGTVVVGGADLSADPMAAKAKIGYVPQEIALYPDLTGRENLRFFCRLFGLPRRQVRGRVEEVLDLVGLADRADAKLDTYSGGMKRRINIGAALLHRPELLILDEPTVGVDPQSRKSILDGLERLVADGMALLYTSHYMEEVERICHRIAIVDHGSVVAEGTRHELVELVGGSRPDRAHPGRRRRDRGRQAPRPGRRHRGGPHRGRVGPADRRGRPVPAALGHLHGRRHRRRHRRRGRRTRPRGHLPAPHRQHAQGLTCCDRFSR